MTKPGLRIRIPMVRIILGSWIKFPFRVKRSSDSHHFDEVQDPDPHYSDGVMQIRNPVLNTTVFKLANPHPCTV